MSDRSSKSEIDEKQFGVMLAALFSVFALGTVLIQWPTLVWSALHGNPSLINPFRALGVGIHRIFVGEWKLPHGWAQILPPLSVAIILDVLLVCGLPPLPRFRDRQNGASCGSISWSSAIVNAERTDSPSSNALCAGDAEGGTPKAVPGLSRRHTSRQDARRVRDRPAVRTDADLSGSTHRQGMAVGAVGVHLPDGRFVGDRAVEDHLVGSFAVGVCGVEGAVAFGVGGGVDESFAVGGVAG